LRQRNDLLKAGANDLSIIEKAKLDTINLEIGRMEILGNVTRAQVNEMRRLLAMEDLKAGVDWLAATVGKVRSAVGEKIASGTLFEKPRSSAKAGPSRPTDTRTATLTPAEELRAYQQIMEPTFDAAERGWAEHITRIAEIKERFVGKALDTMLQAEETRFGQAMVELEQDRAERERDILDAGVRAAIQAEEAKVAAAERADRRLQWLQEQQMKRTQELADDLAQTIAGFATVTSRPELQAGLNALSQSAREIGRIRAEVISGEKTEMQFWAGSGAAALGAASAFTQSERIKAGILAAMEAARAVGSYPDLVGVGVHTVAAGMYAAIAGGAGGGSGATKAKTIYRAPRAATATGPGERGGATYNIHISGIMAGTSRDFARETARLLNANQGLVTLNPGLIGKAGAGGL